MGLKPGESALRAVLAQAGPNNLPGSDAPSQTLLDDSDDLVARIAAPQISRHTKEVDRYYRALLNLDGLPYAKRIERILALKPPAGIDHSLVVDAQPLIYSVGRDGKDDGGLIDSDRDQKAAGDLLYRLPPIEQKLMLKP